MSNINDYIKKIQQAKKFINEDLPDIVSEIAANDLVALIANRVIQRQENYLGTKFGRYSDKKLSYKKLVPSVLAASGRGKVDEIRAYSKKNKGISYAEVRKILGNKNEYKNFQLTGEMWQKFGVTRTEKGETRFIVSLAGKSPKAQEKIDDNTERENISIIEANEDEEQLVQELTKEILEDKLTEYLK